MTPLCHNTLTHFRQVKMAAIMLTAFLNSYSWKMILSVWFKVHWIFCMDLIDNRPVLVHIIAWCRTGCRYFSYYLNQWWPPSLLTHICIAQPRYVMVSFRFNKCIDFSIYDWTDQPIKIAQYGDVIVSAMSSQTPASRLFAQPFVQVQIKENAKAPRHWPLWG